LIQNSKFKIQNSPQGFTLIELLAAMAIIGILAATAVVNFAKNDDRDVRAEKDRLTSFLREAQNKALAGEKVPDFTGKICGFGVRHPIIHSSVCSGRRCYPITKPADWLEVEARATTAATELTEDCGYVLSVPVDLGIYDVLKFTLGTFYPSNGTKVNLAKDVFFLPPSGEATCGTGCTFPVSATITKGSATATVTIEQSGNIH